MGCTIAAIVTTTNALRLLHTQAPIQQGSSSKRTTTLVINISMGSSETEAKHVQPSSRVGLVSYLRHLKAAAQQQVSAIAHEVKERAIGGLVDLEAAGLPLALR